MVERTRACGAYELLEEAAEALRLDDRNIAADVVDRAMATVLLHLTDDERTWLRQRVDL